VESNHCPGGLLPKLPERKDSMNDRQQEYERLIAPIEDRMMRAVWRILRDSKESQPRGNSAFAAGWWSSGREWSSGHRAACDLWCIL
jgi:hypothetical protein